MKYPIGSYVFYGDPDHWENIWKVLNYDSEGYILQNKVGGVLSGFSEDELSLSPDQNPLMIFDKYRFVYYMGTIDANYKNVEIDLIEWACQYHYHAVGYENDEELKIWNEDSDVFVVVYPEWCFWSFDKEGYK